MLLFWFSDDLEVKTSILLIAMENMKHAAS